jgi:uncharacterized protein
MLRSQGEKMIIDGHGHSCGEYLTSDSISDYLSKNNVDYVVLVPGQKGSKKTYKFKEKAFNKEKEILDGTNKLVKFTIGLTNSIKHIPIGNINIFEMKNNNNKIKQFFWAIKSYTINKIQSEYDKMKFDGIKLHQCWERNNFTSSWFVDLIDWLISVDIPLFIHLYSNEDVISIMHIIKKYPKLKIIIAHCYGLEKIITLSSIQLENIFFDISNNYFVPKRRIENALKIVGSTKFTLGSDTPYGLNALKLTIDRVTGLELNESEIDNILGINMKHLLKI